MHVCEPVNAHLLVLHEPDGNSREGIANASNGFAIRYLIFCPLAHAECPLPRENHT